MDNAAGVLGLAKRAGKIEIGEESVSAVVRLCKARLILSASDASENSKEHARNLAGEVGAVCAELPYDKAFLGALLGRGSPGIMAMTDLGFALSFIEKLNAAYPGRYQDAEAALRRKQTRANERKAKTGRAPGDSGKRRT